MWQQGASSLSAPIYLSELAIVMAAICLLSDGDGLVKTMAVISSAPVSQPNSHPAQTDPLVFCWVTEWSQLSQPGPAPAQGARWEHTARRGKGGGRASHCWQRARLNHLILGCRLSKTKTDLALRLARCLYVNGESSLQSLVRRHRGISIIQAIINVSSGEERNVHNSFQGKNK